MRMSPAIGLRAATIAVAAVCLLPLPLRADSPVMATVGGAPITQAEIEQALRLPLYELEMEKYRLTRRRLDQMIVERLLARAAAAQGQSVSAFVSAAVQGAIATITAEEVEARWHATRDQLPGDEERAKQAARNSLVRERTGRALNDLVERLSREAGVSVTVQPPDSPVVKIPVGDDPAWGPPAAPVTIVEFADFACPACKESLPVLRQLRDLYKDQVRLVYRDFPLSSHPQARPAAEAAHCAHEQGKFWAYHDALFTKAPDLKPSDYVTLAERLSLNQAEFTSCLASTRPKAAVAKDLADAQGLGLSGTQTFFINGRYLAG
ncbi:MAG: DsbA family protein, partial [Nitrospirae bacterium]|nr:DsbA family protein [Nitrospirota bacterium]